MLNLGLNTEESQEHDDDEVYNLQVQNADQGQLFSDLDLVMNASPICVLLTTTIFLFLFYKKP